MTTLAVRCDRRLHENRTEQRYRGVNVPSAPAAPLRPFAVPVSAQAPVSRVTPMDIDAVQTGGRRPPISDTERQRRRGNNLCFRCGNPGHIAPFCHLNNNSGNAKDQ